MLRSLLVVTIASAALLSGCTEAEPEPALTLTDQDQVTARIETMCSDASAVLSGLVNAIDGFHREAFDDTEYAQRVIESQTSMTTLLAKGHPEGEVELQAFGDAVAATTLSPVDQVSADVSATSTALNDKVCKPNGTELAIAAEFGG